MPSQIPRFCRRELMGLPNELLLEIVKHLVVQQLKYPALGGIRHSPIYNLSLTNKRLHGIAWPFIWRYLHYHSMSGKELLGFGVHYLRKPPYITNEYMERIWEARARDKNVKCVRRISPCARCSR